MRDQDIGCGVHKQACAHPPNVGERPPNARVALDEALADQMRQQSPRIPAQMARCLCYGEQVLATAGFQFRHSRMPPVRH